MTSTLAASRTASRTAYDCAVVRAHVYATTELDSFDYLAAHVVSRGSASALARFAVGLVRLGATRVTQWLVAASSPGTDIFLFARQVVPDDLIRHALQGSPETQAVILGAGLDTSGLRIGAERRAAGLAPLACFEVDLPAMQAEKRALAKRLAGLGPHLDDAHIRYVPCSFGDEELTKGLLGAGFDPSRPTIWVWSGVVHYLTEGAIRATVADMQRLSGPGSLLFFDFILQEAFERPREYRFDQVKQRFDAYGEVMSFGLRSGTGHVREWLSTQGLRLVRTYTDDEMVRLYQQKTGRTAPSVATRWANLCVAAF